ncbi:putative O-methyltransferase [Botrimarina colliarenosi]|uniref:Putative O-methyltransferase n=1 Tax=Botrimarina colliarenosi TaxID=2528001 RepID=A0A5C6AA85_9BACT|nr:O-methyltransferase [Botrimarina colliarenosi]TWT95233.1 putative O-methyltransferase [Botrimarina colliarenosi]
MANDVWTSVDDYLAPRLVKQDGALEAARAASVAAGLPEIAVTPVQGKLLQVLAKTVAAKHVLEIGTLGGYSTIWLARSVAEGGRVVTLEADPHHAQVAQQNLENAGVADRVDLRVGKAIESLPVLEQEGAGPFDFVFIDADKPSIPDYFRWALKLTRPGSLIVVDNVVRKGKLADSESRDDAVLGCRRLVELLENESRVCATVLQTVGEKGHDGMALAVVL